MKTKSLAIVATLFFACAARAVDWPGAGETYTVPANTTNVVSDADIDDYNALGKVVFTDATSALLFTTDTAPNVPLEGAGWMIKDSSSTGKWTNTTQQTTAWVGTWDVRGGEISMDKDRAGHNGLFNSDCADLHDVYIRPGAKVTLSDKPNCKTFTKARIFLGGQLNIYTSGNVAPLRQVEVTDDGAVMYLGNTTIPVFYDLNSSNLSYLKLNGHTLAVNGKGVLGFAQGKVVGPGELTINCDRGVTIHPDANGGAATDFMFCDPTVTVKVNWNSSSYPLSNRYQFGQRAPWHPTCPQLAKLVTLKDVVFFEHYHTNALDCSSIAPYIWAGPVELNGDLKLRRVLAPGEDNHFLAFDFKGGLSKDAGTRAIGFDPVVFTNAVVRYHGAIPSGLKHDGFRWDGRFDLASDIELNHMMYLAETNGAVGIVRQQGGSVTLLGGTIFGRNGGYPAYLLEGGTLTFPSGDLFFNGTYTHFRQTGGTFRPYDIHKTAREGDLRTDVVIEGDSQLVKGHYGFRNFRGPICIAVCGNAQADLGWFGNADAAVQAAMAPHEHIFALNGGFTTMNSYANLTNYYAFNGGTLATTYGQHTLFGREDGKPWVRIYEKGGELRTIDGLRSVNLPALKEPEGNVVWSIALTDELRGKVWQSPPAVYIDDATGSNAVAVVDYDFDSGKVTNITVVCRGENYTPDGATANLYYRAGEKLLENNLVCTTGPCQGFDVTLSSTEKAGVFRYLGTNAGMTNTFHGTLTVDMDMSKCADYGGTLTNGVSGDTPRYGGSLNLYESSQVCFLNCTNIVLKSGMIYSVAPGGSRGLLNHKYPEIDAFPDCNRIELYGGHLAGGRIEYRETVIGGRIALISHNMVNDAGYLYIPTNGTLYIDAPSVVAGNTPSLEKGRFYFGSGAKVKIQNPETLRDLDGSRVLLDLSGTSVSGTVVFEPPAGLEDVVSFRWDETAKKLYARKKLGGFRIIFK